MQQEETPRRKIERKRKSWVQMLLIHIFIYKCIFLLIFWYIIQIFHIHTHTYMIYRSTKLSCHLPPRHLLHAWRICWHTNKYPLNIYIYIYIYVYVYMCMYICIYIYIYECVYIYIQQEETPWRKMARELGVEVAPPAPYTELDIESLRYVAT